jgi:hypothetical protein
MSTTTAAATPSIIEKLETAGHEALDAVEHAAVWLVGKIAVSSESLHDLEAASPWVTQAWAAGVASAEAHGIPVTAIENVGAAILTLAKTFAAGLSQPAPVPAIPSAA